MCGRKKVREVNESASFGKALPKLAPEQQQHDLLLCYDTEHTIEWRLSWVWLSARR